MFERVQNTPLEADLGLLQHLRCFQPLTIITERSIFDVAAALDLLPLASSYKSASFPGNI